MTILIAVAFLFTRTLIKIYGFKDSLRFSPAPFGFRRWQSLWLCIDLIRHKEWWLSETVQCMSRCFDISSISTDSLVLWHEQCMSRLLWSNQWQHLIVTSDKEVSTNLWGWVYFSTTGSIPSTYSLTKSWMVIDLVDDNAAICDDKLVTYLDI